MKILLLFMLFLLTPAFGVSLKAQTKEVSLVETVQWLQKYEDQIKGVSVNIGNNYSSDISGGWKIYTEGSVVGTRVGSSDTQNCRLILTNQNYESDKKSLEDQKKDIKKNRFVISRINFSLANLNPSKVSNSTVFFNNQYSRTGLTLNTTNRTNAFSLLSTYRSEKINRNNPKFNLGDSDNVNNITIIFDDKKMAERFRNAFINAIKVCGGKDDKEIVEPF